MLECVRACRPALARPAVQSDSRKRGVACDWPRASLKRCPATSDQQSQHNERALTIFFARNAATRAKRRFLCFLRHFAGCNLFPGLGFPFHRAKGVSDFGTLRCVSLLDLLVGVAWEL